MTSINMADSKILGIISWIKESENMAENWKKHTPNPAATLMVAQFEDQKRAFIKQLLAELIQSTHNISDFEPFFVQATSYLKKFENANFSSNQLTDNLKEVEQFMVIAA